MGISFLKYSFLIVFFLMLSVKVIGKEMDDLNVSYELSAKGEVDLIFNDIKIFSNEGEGSVSGFGRLMRFLLPENKLKVVSSDFDGLVGNFEVFTRQRAPDGFSKNIILSCELSKCNGSKYAVNFPDNTHLMRASAIELIDQSDKKEIYNIFLTYLKFIKAERFNELDEMFSLYIDDVELMDPEISVKPSETMPEFLEFLDKKDLQFTMPELDDLIFNIAMDKRVVYLSSKAEDAQNRKGAFRFATPIFSKINNKWKIIRTN